MGEKSKKIGEIGENIVENFLKLIGWNAVLSGQELKCRKHLKHARKESKTQHRETHGIDFLYCYKSPLESSTIENIIISVKHTKDSYGNSPKTIFKKHVEDLVFTLECYKNSELKKFQLESFGRAKKTKDTGLLFWLSSSEETYDDAIAKVSNLRQDQDWIFESFHVVDNKRISFVYDVLGFLKGNFPDININFYYPETALSYVDDTIPRSGLICPVEFLTSPVIPFMLKPKKSDLQDIFCLASIDPFDYDGIRRLLKAAKEYTQEVSCQYLFIFPNYVSSNHSGIIRQAFSELENDFISRVKVMSYHPDFRSLSNE